MEYQKVEIELQSDFPIEVLMFENSENTRPNLILKNSPKDYDYLMPFFNRKISFSNRIASHEAGCEELGQIVLEITREWQVKLEGYQMVIRSMLMKLLALLYRNFKVNQCIQNLSRRFVCHEQR
ncbi:MAG: hypothetical protein WCQ41_08700 [Bacillota bacterium]